MSQAIASTAITVSSLSFLVALIGLIIGTRQATAIVDPLRRLKEDAERIGRGDLDAEVASGSRDETGQLAESFNRMRHELKTARDGLQRVHNELEKRVAERTAQLSQAVGELESFSYTVSHDLRTPLQVIAGYNGLLLECSQKRLEPQEIDYLRQVDQATHRMQSLIDDLLDFSTVSHGDLRCRTMDLSEMARSTASELLRSGNGRTAEFRIGAHISAVGDPSLLQVVMDNLLGNAWKYTGKRERAIIEFGCSEVKDTPVYFVRDNGEGFDMSHAGALFAPFQRLHRSDQFEGTGIGLATVKRIIVRHGGTVRALGKPGGGAVICFTLQHVDDDAMTDLMDRSDFLSFDV